MTSIGLFRDLTNESAASLVESRQLKHISGGFVVVYGVVNFQQTRFLQLR